MSSKSSNGCGCMLYFVVFCILLRACGMITITDKDNSSEQISSSSSVSSSESKAMPVSDLVEKAISPHNCSFDSAVDSFQSVQSDFDIIKLYEELYAQDFFPEVISPKCTNKYLDGYLNWLKEEGLEKIRPEDMRGRGHCDILDYEPQYVGVEGFIAITNNYYEYIDASPYKNDELCIPWKASMYEKDKQFWNVVGIVDHKTPVIVREQELEKGGHGTYRYNGYLLVERLDTKEQFYISVIDFVTVAYWESEDLNEIITMGPCLAKYRQVSDYYPVDRFNNKADIEENAIVMVKGKNSGGWADSENNPIEAFDGKSNYYFNIKDLTIIY